MYGKGTASVKYQFNTVLGHMYICIIWFNKVKIEKNIWKK